MKLTIGTKPLKIFAYTEDFKSAYEGKLSESGCLSSIAELAIHAHACRQRIKLHN